MRITTEMVDYISQLSRLSLPEEEKRQKNQGLWREAEAVRAGQEAQRDLLRMKDNEITRLNTALTYARTAEDICALLERGKTVAMLTLGDPTVYSTYMYVHRLVEEKGYEARVIPGVPSFCAAAAALGTPLCEGKERLLIIPAGYEGLEESLDVEANKVLMKAGRSITELQDLLRRRGELDRASLAANCGMEGETLYPHFADMDDPTGYFSIVIVRDKD